MAPLFRSLEERGRGRGQGIQGGGAGEQVEWQAGSVPPAYPPESPWCLLGTGLARLSPCAGVVGASLPPGGGGGTSGWGGHGRASPPTAAAAPWPLRCSRVPQGIWANQSHPSPGLPGDPHQPCGLSCSQDGPTKCGGGGGLPSAFCQGSMRGLVPALSPPPTLWPCPPL